MRDLTGRRRLMMPGGGGGGGAGRQTTTKESSRSVQRTNLSPEQEQILQSALPFAQQFAENPPQPFPESTVAPESQLEQRGRQQRLQAGQQIGQVTPDTVAAQTALLDPSLLNPTQSEVFRNATQAAIDPLIENFQRQVLPQIQSGAVSTGNVGSSRQGVAEGLAAEGLADTIANTTSRMALTQQQQGIDALLGGLRTVPSTVATIPAQAEQTQLAGRQDRELRQALIDDEVRRFLQERMLPIQTAGDLVNLLQGIPGGEQVTETEGLIRAPDNRARPPSTAQNILGGAASGAALGSKIGSIGGLPGAGVGAAVGGLGGLFF